MIRSWMLAAGVVALGTTAASAETHFIGSIIVTAVTAQCQHVHVGDGGTSHFHPIFVGQNDQTEGLSFAYQFGGDGYQLANHVLDTTFRTVETGGLGWSGVFIRPQNQWAQIGNVTHSPATITASSPWVILRGQIKRMNDDPGGLACVATFIAAYVRVVP